jgi:hypothetical protein
VASIGVGLEGISSSPIIESEDKDMREDDALRYKGSPNMTFRHWEADVDTWLGTDSGMAITALSLLRSGVSMSFPENFLQSWAPVTRSKEVTRR